jgi:RNA polymerase sigma-70 factor (ECF subfamily)
VLGAQHPDVEDVTQEALVGVLEALARFRGESSVTHFIRRVALLTALNARRRHQLREHLAPRAAWEDASAAVASRSSPAEEVETQRRLRSFEALLDELPAPQAEAIALHCVLGYTVGETAELCRVPENTVRSRLAGAKATLRKRLQVEALLEARIRGVS